MFFAIYLFIVKRIYMAKYTISEAKLTNLINESIREVLSENEQNEFIGKALNGLARLAGRGRQKLRNMGDDIRANYKLGKQQQNFRDRDRDEYAGVNDINDTLNYGEQESRAYREKLDRERRRNATWYPKYSENYDDAFTYFNNLRSTGYGTPSGGAVTQGGGGSGVPNGGVVTQGGGGSTPSGNTVTQSGGGSTPSGNTVTQSGGGSAPSGGASNQGEFEVQRPWDDFRKRQGIMPNPNLVGGEGSGVSNSGDGKITPINKPNPKKGKMNQRNRGQSTNIDRLKLKKAAEEKMMDLRMYNAGTPQYPNWKPRDNKRSNELKAQQKAAKKEWMRYATDVGIRENKLQKIVSESIRKVLNEQNRRRHK